MESEAEGRSPSRSPERYTSVYLDADSRSKLDHLAADTGQSRSHVIRGLIQGADGYLIERLGKIVEDLRKLIGS
jgi:predicted transcriptional regulator